MENKETDLFPALLRYREELEKKFWQDGDIETGKILFDHYVFHENYEAAETCIENLLIFGKNVKNAELANAWAEELCSIAIKNKDFSLFKKICSLNLTNETVRYWKDFLRNSEAFLKNCKKADVEQSRLNFAKGIAGFWVKETAPLQWFYAINFSRDFEEKKEYLISAANFKYKPAYGSLSYCYINEVVPPDFVEGLKWLKLSDSKRFKSIKAEISAEKERVLSKWLLLRNILFSGCVIVGVGLLSPIYIEWDQNIDDEINEGKVFLQKEKKKYFETTDKQWREIVDTFFEDQEKSLDKATLKLVAEILKKLAIIVFYSVLVWFIFSKFWGRKIERTTFFINKYGPKKYRFYMYLDAAGNGDVKAQNNLGNCYAAGDGVPADKSKAFEWYCKAAERGYVEAQFNLGNCYYNNGILEDKSKAVEWYRIAAARGYVKAQFNLGNSYFNGEGIPECKSKAFEWFSKAAEKGLAEAQYNLGVCYANGEGIPESKSKAVKWFRKAAEQGFAMAQFKLGVCYANGDGVPVNKFQALEWLRKVGEQGVDVRSEIEKIIKSIIPLVQIPGKNWQIGKYEVTQAEYRMIMGKTPSYFKGDNLPVEQVSWNDAVAFCEKLTKYTREAGLICRLPTAAEWEYACRAGTTTKYCSGDSEKDLSRVAWWDGNSGNRTHPVGTREPNAWGIYDMHGNVWEWCQDLDYTGSDRVSCGGGCYNGAGGCESSSVKSDSPVSRYRSLGFRVVLAPM